MLPTTLLIYSTFVAACAFSSFPANLSIRKPCNAFLLLLQAMTFVYPFFLFPTVRISIKVTMAIGIAFGARAMQSTRDLVRRKRRRL